MVYNKKFIQFNDLVFDTVSNMQSAAYTASAKTFASAYSFRHGDYMPFKNTHVLLNSSTVSMTLIFDLKMINCEERPLYIDFIREQLARHGKLWAVQNNTLLWAYATMTNYREDTNLFKDRYIVDVNFVLYEGVWHKADWLRTFLVPYDYCTFTECFAFPTYDPCTSNCCNCVQNALTPCNCECDCVKKEDALCYNKDIIPSLYDCDTGYRVIYSCTAAEKYFGDFLDDAHLGQKLCSSPTDCPGWNDSGLASGQFISRTDIPTENIRIRLHGEFKNLRIVINDNENVFKGELSGVVDIRPNGEVYNYELGCVCDEPLSVDTWAIPTGMDYGWQVRQGANRVLIDAGTCCPFCAWIESDDITY